MLDDIKKTLWATADKLRANMDAAEYKHLTLGLALLKYVPDMSAVLARVIRQRISSKPSLEKPLPPVS